MKFMLMMHAPQGDGDYDVSKWPMDALQAHIGFMKTLNEELQKDGSFVGAEGLASPAKARVVRVAANGAPEVTDGPFAESKEFLAGYWIVQVASPEQAYAIAARISSAPGMDGQPLRIPVEVREVHASAPIEV